MKTKLSLQIITGLILFFSFFSSQLSAQTTIILGTGTTYSANQGYPTPYANYYWGNKEQYIIRASEFNTLGFSGGYINSLAWDVLSMNSCPGLNNFSIKIGTTSLTDLAGSNFVNTGLTTVYTTSTQYGYTGWNTFNFASPFYWDGTSNVVIEVCFNNSGYVNYGNASVYNTTTSFNSCLNAHQDNGTVCSLTGGSAYSLRPNLKFEVQNLNAANDLAMVSIVSPINNDSPSSTKDFTIKFTNRDSTAQDTIPLKYSVNGGITWVTEYYYPSVNFQDTITYTFTTKANMPSNGYYNCHAKVDFPGDGNATNNLVTSTVFLCQQMGGTYTVGSGGDYPTINDAISSMSYCGVGDTVTLNMLPGTYTGPQVFYDNGYSTALKPLIIQSSTGNPNDVIFQYATSSSATNYVFLLSGAKYHIFKNITIKNTSTSSSYANVISLGANSNYNQFIGCNIIGTNTTSASNYISNIYCAAVYTKGNVFKNNSIQNGSYAIYYSGTSSTTRSDSISFEGNTMINFYYMGAYIANHNYLKVSKNIISTNSVYSGLYYIYNYYVNSGLVEKNTLIYSNTSASNQIYGIYSYYCQSSLSTPLYYTNNSISLSNQSGLLYGFQNNYCNYLNVAYNSVRINSTNNTAAALYISSGSNNNVYNNIFCNAGLGYSIYIGSSTYIYACDYNNLYSTGSYLAYWAGNMASLTALKTASMMNTFSVNVNPDFYTNTDLHTNSIGLNGKAVPLSFVTDDFDNQTRNASTPDIGCDEFTPLANDAGIVALTEPIGPCPGVPSVVKVRIKNYGTSPLTSATIGWSVNGVAQTTFNWSGSISTGNDAIASIGSFSFNSGSASSVKAYVLSVNGGVDLNPINDTNLTQVSTSMSGTYTIGASNANYTTIADAILELSQKGVCGPISFKIQDGNYNEQIALTAISGASSVNTITFESLSNDSSKVTITSSLPSSYSNNYIVNLNGANYIQFKNLTLVYNQSNVNYCGVVTLSNGAKNNTFDKVHMIGINYSGTSTYYAIVNNIGDFNDYNTFKNCSFDYGSYGIYFIGSSSYYIKGLTIEKNRFYENLNSAIYINYVDSSLISKNYLYNSFATTSITYYGIYLYYSNVGLKIEKNKVYALCPISYPLYVANCYGTTTNPLLISNNYILKANGTSYTNRGVYLYNCTYVNFYNNTIRMKDTYASSYALYTQNGSQINIVNNNIVHSGGGYAYYVSTTGAIVTTNYNNLYTSGTYIAYWGGNRTTLALLKSYSGKDANSKSVNPTFVNTNDCYLYDANLNNAGTYLSSVTDDIDNDIRNMSTPDIGCDEFSMNNYDANLYAIVSPTISTSGGTKQIKVSIRNMGLVTMTSATLYYKLDNNAAVAYNWTGNLSSLSVDSNILIGSTAVSLGSHSLKTWTSNPNGQTDQNMSNDTLTLQFFAAPKPEILVNPTSIVRTIASCNDSVIAPLKVYNIGTAPLTFTTDSSAAGVMRILGLYLGSTYSGSYANAKTALFSQLTNYTFTETNTTDPNTLAGMLANADVVLVGPFTSTAYYSTYTAFATPLQNFVNAGGGVVFCASAYPNYYNNTGLLNVSTTYANTSYASTVLDVNHPINLGIGTTSVSYYTNTYYHNNADANYVSLYDLTGYSGWTIGGYKNYGQGKVVYLGFDYTTTNSLTSKVLGNSVKWASKNAGKFFTSSPYSGTIAAGDSTTINLKFKSYGFANGTYNGSLIINSNDSNNLQKNVPVTLTINGPAAIGMLNNPFNKGATFAGVSYYDTLKVFNTGCDSLRITNVISNQGALVPLTTNKVISPKDTGYLAFKFTPVAGGNFTANVTILNNVGTYYLTYNSTVTLPPSISITPNPVNATISYCGDSILFPLTVSNTGGGVLNVTTNSASNTDTVKIVALINGYYNGYYANMESAINTAYPKNTITTSYAASASQLLTDITGKDVVLIPYMNSDMSTTYTLFASTLQSFVNNGGTVIFAGQYYHNVVLNTGLFTSTGSGYTSGVNLSVLNTTHTITKNFPTSFTHNSYFSTIKFTNTDVVRLVTYSSTSDIISYRNIGNGRVIYMGSYYSNTSGYDSQALGNAIKYVAENKTPAWMNFTQSSANISGGSSTVLNIRMRSVNLNTGTYTGSVTLFSNDPVYPTKVVPCTLNVQNILQNMVNIGNDTIVCGSVTLNAGTYLNYTWSTGATSSTINVTNTGSYAVTVSNGTVCSDRDTITVIVNPLPTVNYSGLPTNACTNGGTISLTGSPSGGTYVGIGMTGNVFNPLVAGTGIKTITYVYTNAQNCTNSISKSVQVSDPPAVLFTGLSPNYCPSGSSSTLVGAPIGGVYSGPGISGNVFNPANSGSGNIHIIYSYTDANGCTNKDTNSTFVYQPAVADILGLGSNYCSNANPVTLSSTYPGGTYSGNGVSGNTFTPSVAGVGTHPIRYIVSDNNGCTTGDTINVNVHALPASASFSGLTTGYCANVDSILLTGNPSGGAFSGPGISGNYFRPLVAGAGAHKIKYTITNANGCSKSDSATVNVYALPTITISGLQNAYCLNNANVLVTPSPVGGSLVGTGILGTIFSPSFAGVGTHSIKYTYTNANNCTSKDSIMVVVNPLPVVNFSGLATSYCKNASSSNLVGSPIGGTFSGSGISGTVFNPLNANTGAQQITYTYTDLNSCTNTHSKSVTVFPIPTVNAGSDVTITNGSFASLSGTVSGGSGSFNTSWSPASQVVNPNSLNTNTISLSGTTVFTLTAVDIGYSCTNTDQKTVTVTGGALTGVATASPQVICAGGISQLSMTATGGSGNYTYSWTSNPAGFTSSIANPIVNPTATTTYTCVVNDGSSNTSSSLVITVNAKPTVAISGLNSSYCSNEPIVNVQVSPLGGTLTGSGINGLTFNPATASMSTFNVIYAFMDGFGCFNSDTVEVTVKLSPTASAGQDTSLPCGHPGILIGQQPLTGVSYLWTPSFGIANPSLSNTLASPNFTINYILTATNISNGCTAKDTVLIKVTGTPTAVAIGDTTICHGSPVPLGASGGSKFLWITGDTTSTINVSPYSTTNYWVIVSDGNCADADTVTVTVRDTEANLGPDTAICSNRTYILNAKPGFVSYLWSNGSTSQTITVDSIGVGYGTKTIWCQVTDQFGCFGRDTVKVEFKNCTGIEPNEVDYSYMIIPNPTNAKFRLVSNEIISGEILIEIYDLRGKLIYSETLKSDNEKLDLRFDLGNYPKGMYFIKTRTNQNVKTQRVIIQ